MAILSVLSVLSALSGATDGAVIDLTVTDWAVTLGRSPNVLALLLPPIAGAVIGYFTNDLAINMLFRPYRPIVIRGWQVPFTPGLIPRNQDRLAQRVADTILGSLLTPSELQNIARRLLAAERVQGAIQWLLRLFLEQLQTGDRQTKLSQSLAGVLHDLLGDSLPRLLRVWARDENFLKDQFNGLFDRLVLEFRLSSGQAKRLAQWLTETVLAPNTIRLGLIEFLSEENIAAIDENFRERTSGTYWLVANLLGVRNSLIRLKAFCLEEPAAANQQFAELVVSLQVRTRLGAWLQRWSLEELPVSTVRQLRRTLRESFRDFLQNRGAKMLQDFSDHWDWQHLADLLLNRLKTSVAFQGSLDRVSTELALILDRYVERDLESMVAKALPILDLDRVIVERISQTSPENLEAGVQAIVKSELQAIVNLGGILGLLIGLLQTGLLWFQSGRSM